MALIGSVVNQGSLQGEIASYNGALSGVFANTGLVGGQVVGMRGLQGEKGDKGDAGTTDYEFLENKPQIEGVTLVGDKSFEDLTLLYLRNTEIEELLK